MAKIVCFGGGNGIPQLVMAPLKDKYDITAVTSMTDSGGSAGALRREFNALPPGDIRRHLLALSEAEQWKKDLWQFRFGNDVEFEIGHKGHVFANAFIVGLEKQMGFEKALEILHEFMKVKGKALPATIEQTNIVAELEDGTKAVGEDEIDVPRKHDGNKKVVRVFPEPQVAAYPPVIEAIKSADFIIIGPGDMYSSLAPCFLPTGMKEALKETKAKKIFIVSAMTKFGETNNYTLADFVEKIEQYTGPVDFVVYNTTKPTDAQVATAKKHNEQLLEPVDASAAPQTEKFVGADLLAADEAAFTSEKLVPVLEKIIG